MNLQCDMMLPWFIVYARIFQLDTKFHDILLSVPWHILLLIYNISYHTISIYIHFTCTQARPSYETANPLMVGPGGGHVGSSISRNGQAFNTEKNLLEYPW